ncbi:hypothetical protein MUG10_01135 [Xanthomonas prunicola]|uniref:hypothetical protein n=1 Tax=Xanthomonas prunicola TaxID=2053930 RepID=UPI002078EBF0|nr:hypothetical protein [Xanthomonas prunicola]USJ00901.1 hypothetical protein MUG10_01135 [Xanthomonas prunicola]
MDWWYGFSQCAPPSAACVVNWSAWSTIVSVLLGILTAAIGWLAWMTSRSAVRIARKQQDDVVKLREDTAKIIVHILINEVSSLPARSAMMLRYLNSSVWWANEHRHSNTIVHANTFNAFIDECKKPMLPSAEQLQERIHNLPTHFGPDLATLIGTSRTLNDSALRISQRLLPPEPIPGNFASGMDYDGNDQDLNKIREDLSWLFDASKQYANQFQELAGVAPYDYSGDTFRTDGAPVKPQFVK